MREGKKKVIIPQLFPHLRPSGVGINLWRRQTPPPPLLSARATTATHMSMGTPSTHAAPHRRVLWTSESLVSELPTPEEFISKLAAAYKGILNPDPYISSPVYATIAVALVGVGILIAVIIYQQFALCLYEESLGEKPSMSYVKMQRQASFQRRAKKSSTPSEPICAPPSSKNGNGGGSSSSYSSASTRCSPSNSFATAVAAASSRPPEEPDLPPPTPAHVSLARQKSFERRKKNPAAGGAAAEMV